MRVEEIGCVHLKKITAVPIKSMAQSNNTSTLNYIKFQRNILVKLIKVSSKET